MTKSNKSRTHFKVGDKVTNIVTLNDSPGWIIFKDSLGEVEAVFHGKGRKPRMFVRFSSTLSGTWTQKSFKKIEEE